MSIIEGGDYDQVKIQSGQGSVPDPRVAGPAIFFDSRMDDAQDQSAKSDPLLQAMG